MRVQFNSQARWRAYQLLPRCQVLDAGLRNVCQQVCSVRKTKPLSVPGLVVEIVGADHGLFQAVACLIHLPSVNL